MELEEAKELLIEMRENCLKENSAYNDTKRKDKAEAIDTVIAELHAMQNLLDEKNEELDRLQKENKGIKARVDKYIQGGNETLRLEHEETLKYYHENYISKDKIREKIEELENETWYIDSGVEAKQGCIEVLQELLGDE